jgi:C1A family cysteine protease
LKNVFTPSRLFIYYNERAMEGTIDSDSGAMIRDGVKSVAKQGACDEASWPYEIDRFQARKKHSSAATRCWRWATKSERSASSSVTRGGKMGQAWLLHDALSLPAAVVALE